VNFCRDLHKNDPKFHPLRLLYLKKKSFPFLFLNIWHVLKRYLFAAAWVDRAGSGWLDRLGDLADGGPTIIVKGVDEAVEAIKKWAPPKV